MTLIGSNFPGNSWVRQLTGFRQTPLRFVGARDRESGARLFAGSFESENPIRLRRCHGPLTNVAAQCEWGIALLRGIVQPPTTPSTIERNGVALEPSSSENVLLGPHRADSARSVRRCLFENSPELPGPCSSSPARPAEKQTVENASAAEPASPACRFRSGRRRTPHCAINPLNERQSGYKHETPEAVCVSGVCRG